MFLQQPKIRTLSSASFIFEGGGEHPEQRAQLRPLPKHAAVLLRGL
jgi:hypothetical protein